MVEDDPVMLSLLTTYLELEGFEVVKYRATDTSHEDILNTLRREKPEGLVMDVNLEHVDGLEVLRKIKQEEDLKKIRIVMYSGMDVAYQAKKAGADDFIMKPFMPGDLLAKINRLMF
ncbi:MAG: response regulator [Chloroflexota bacterium]